MTSGPILVIGSTGLLGQALMTEIRRRGYKACGLARHSAEVSCDITDGGGLATAISSLGPRCVINAAAVTSLDACEANPSQAWLVNARAPGMLAEFCRDRNIKFVHVSTDHYYSGDGAARHDEAAPVRIVNEYARTKYAAEGLALAVPDSLVVRTNITGWRGWAGRPTFFEWAVDSLESRKEMTLFTDFYTSTIDAPTCASRLIDLIDRGATGILNLASRDVADKETFVRAIAKALRIEPNNARSGSVASLYPIRAESLGLNVAKAERLLGLRLPGLEDVVQNLIQARPA